MKVQQSFPSLQCEITGEYDQENGLAYFRGIPYATVNKRWTHSVTKHQLDSPFDATRFGPRCVQREGEVLVSGGTNDPTPGDDEFKCLNLNVTVPKECLQEFAGGRVKTNVPVMFWIHGGGFLFGANSVARYRPHKLCGTARQEGQPIILVQIGYRLGALGFAASNDLAKEQSQAPNANGSSHRALHSSVGNYGFVDQLNALEWVQHHIKDFGGDPTNVTAFGISAGSASVHYHILTGSPMFDRAICMSGSAPTIGPQPFERYEEAWQELCANTGLKEETSEARLDRLRAMNPLSLLCTYTPAVLGPMADGTLLPKSWTFETPLSTRCRSIILGDTNVEGIIFDRLAQRMKPPQFQLALRSVLSPDSVDEFNRHFGFSNDDVQPYEVYRDALRRFLSIMNFQFPNLRIAETFKKASGGGTSFLYHFEDPSPFPGPTFGLSYHGQCALYMYNVESDLLPIESRQIAERMARSWIGFANGIQPWEAYPDNKRFMRFGPRGKGALISTQEDETRAYEYVDWLRENFEQVKLFTQSI